LGTSESATLVVIAKCVHCGSRVTHLRCDVGDLRIWHVVELTKLIRKRKFYQASNWLAAKAFGVRKRLLQRVIPPSE